MTTDTATSRPLRRTGPRRRYSEQLHTLVDEQTRAYILGVADDTAEANGYATLREAEETRELLDEAIAARYADDPGRYAAAVTRGRGILAARRNA